MIDRSLIAIISSETWGRQMRFITGPRQSGKTTLAKQKLKENSREKLYYLWDLREVRNRYKENELFFTEDSPPSKKKQWLCFDEIHKMPKWKNILKGVFDATQEHYQFIITGSAKLNIFKRAGDSLSGRYFTFHLLPLTLREAIKNPFSNLTPPKKGEDFILEQLDKNSQKNEVLNQLLEFSGFPEPFLKKSKKFYQQWSNDYLDRVIQEDISALTRIIEHEKLYELYHLLPEKVGSLFSIESAARDLDSNSPTIKSYLKRLEDFYLAFRISPYSKKIRRSLKKAGKVYLFDWARISDKGSRFENYAAVELLNLKNIWTINSPHIFDLHFVRQKAGKESDFLLTKDSEPWLLFETKLTDGNMEKHHLAHANNLGEIPIIQICQESKVAKQTAKNAYRISAHILFG